MIHSSNDYQTRQLRASAPPRWKILSTWRSLGVRLASVQQRERNESSPSGVSAENQSAYPLNFMTQYRNLCKVAAFKLGGNQLAAGN